MPVPERRFLQTAEEAARLAGTVLAQWRNKITVRQKSAFNLVTEADLASQEAIVHHIRAQHPEHRFLGEENLTIGDPDSPYRWIIDPLDGTTNYVHGFPYYAVSIALERANELLVGTIFDPNRDEMFSAVRGGGALMNGSAIHPSSTQALGKALAVASLPVDAGRDHPAVEQFLSVLPLAQALQRTGSAALNLAYVACGRIDVYWSTSLKPWDMAAGALIVSEAGGRVSKLDGSPVDIGVPDVLASNGTKLHDEMIEVLQPRRATDRNRE